MSWNGKYLDLDELKTELDKRGIKYTYVSTKSSEDPVTIYDKDGTRQDMYFTGAPLLYVSPLIQIDNPTPEQVKQFYPYVRVSRHDGSDGYYVRNTGVIVEDAPIEEVLEMINDCLSSTEKEADPKKKLKAAIIEYFQVDEAKNVSSKRFRNYIANQAYHAVRALRDSAESNCYGK